MAQPEIAILVSTFERPRHLARVLASIAAQQGVCGAVEVVVTDDGSRDETPRLVREFAASAAFRVSFTSHPHAGFHIARCRNEGVAATTAPYLLFLDGDCIIPPDHLRQHLTRRREGFAMAGYPVYLNREISEQIAPGDIHGASYLQRVTAWQRLQMRWRHVRGQIARLTGDPLRPKLLGGNLGIARADYERVNGYDENFRGWGCEDDDLRRRLCAAGVGIASIAWWTNTYHLWHPKTPTAPATWREGANVEYFRRPLRLTRCLAGLKKRRLQDVNVTLAGGSPPPDLLERLPVWCRVAAASHKASDEWAELEILFAGDGSQFSRQADCRVLIAADAHSLRSKLVDAAHVVFTPQITPRVPKEKNHLLSELNCVLEQQLGSSHLGEWAQRAAA